MPKFLRIGVLQSNVSGYTSKAWCIRRVGSVVFLKWGAVEVNGAGDGRKVAWSRSPQEKTIRCGTAQRAQDYAKAAIARRRSHRYEPLTGPIALRRRSANAGAELKQALATILIVDIVGSTAKAAKLGDARWTKVMGHYYAAVRKELKSSRGKEVVTTGDGVLATFKKPAAGVNCATAIQKAVRTLGLEIRVGLHAGEHHQRRRDGRPRLPHRHPRRRQGARRGGFGVERGEGADEDAICDQLKGSRRAPAEGCAGKVEAVAGGGVKGLWAGRQFGTVTVIAARAIEIRSDGYGRALTWCAPKCGSGRPSVRFWWSGSASSDKLIIR